MSWFPQDDETFAREQELRDIAREERARNEAEARKEMEKERDK